MSTVPQLLDRFRTGDESAPNELVKELYNELHRIAARKLGAERSGHTSQTSALIHEAYVKLVGDNERQFANKFISSPLQRASCGRSWWTTVEPTPPRSVPAVQWL